MKNNRMKNKVLQMMYRPGKSSVAGPIVKTMEEIDKSLTKSINNLTGKKSKSKDGDKKEEKKTDKEKKDDKEKKA